MGSHKLVIGLRSTDIQFGVFMALFSLSLLGIECRVPVAAPYSPSTSSNQGPESVSPIPSAEPELTREIAIPSFPGAPEQVKASVNSGPQAAVSPTQGPLVPAFFIFGDSLVDVGNNNYLGSLARADYYPNGIDYPGGVSTGRFCNGKTVLDFIGDFIGLAPPPPFLAPSTHGVNLLGGVNYASGAGGILNSSGELYLERIGFDGQLENFEINIGELNLVLGPAAAATLVNEALYAVVIGSNDYINNYLQTTNSPTKSLYSPPEYQDYLITTFAQQLTTLYTLGARKVVVSGVGPLGCIPDQMSMLPTDQLGKCIPDVNALVVSFNAAVLNMLDALNAKLPEALFVYSNAYDVVMNLVVSGLSQGFSVPNWGCCGLGRLNGQFPCLPVSSLCDARSTYIFWDAFHPTEATNRVLANRMWTGGVNDSFPLSVHDLVVGY